MNPYPWLVVRRGETARACANTRPAFAALVARSHAVESNVRFARGTHLIETGLIADILRAAQTYPH